MIEILGWAGTVGYLLNHAGFAMVRRYPPNLYFGLNLISAVLLVASSLAINSWHPVVNNGFWAITSLIALVGLRPRRITANLPERPWLLALLAFALIILVLTGQGLAFPALGWVSVATYAAAYVSLTLGAIGRKQYLAVNLFAALLQIPILTVDGNLPVLGLQIAWAVLSLIGLARRIEADDDTPQMMDLPPGGVANAHENESSPQDNRED